jgi:hypothetical protein
MQTLKTPYLCILYLFHRLHNHGRPRLGHAERAAGLPGRDKRGGGGLGRLQRCGLNPQGWEGGSSGCFGRLRLHRLCVRDHGRSKRNLPPLQLLISLPLLAILLHPILLPGPAHAPLRDPAGVLDPHGLEGPLEERAAHDGPVVVVDARVGGLVPAVVGGLGARHDLRAEDVPVAVLAVVVVLKHAARGVGGEHRGDELPALVDPAVLVAELLYGGGLLPVVEVVLDAAVAGGEGEALQLQNEVVPCREVVLAPDIADVARQTADVERADEVDGEGHRGRTALVLAALELRGVRDPPGPGDLCDKADGVPDAEDPALGVRVFNEPEVDHELLPVQGVAVVPEALQSREDVIDGHDVDEGVDHPRELQPLKRGKVRHHGPAPVDAQDEADVADVDRVAQGEGALGVRVGEVELWYDFCYLMGNVQIGGLVAEVGGLAVVIRGDIAQQIGCVIDPRCREERGRRAGEGAIVHYHIGFAHVGKPIEQ